MDMLLIGIAVLFVCIVLYLLWSSHYALTDPHQWFDYVEQAAFREKKADMQRRFPVYRILGSQSGGWVDYGAHDNGDGTTSWYAQDGRSTRFSYRSTTRQH